MEENEKEQAEEKEEVGILKYFLEYAPSRKPQFFIIHFLGTLHKYGIYFSNSFYFLQVKLGRLQYKLDYDFQQNQVFQK